MVAKPTETGSGLTDPALSKIISTQFQKFANDNSRLNLADKYPHITRLLIQHPEHRGQEGEITSAQLKTLADKHGCMDLYNRSDLAAHLRLLHGSYRNLAP